MGTETQRVSPAPVPEVVPAAGAVAPAVAQPRGNSERIDALRAAQGAEVAPGRGAAAGAALGAAPGAAVGAALGAAVGAALGAGEAAAGSSGAASVQALATEQGQGGAQIAGAGARQGGAQIAGQGGAQGGAQIAGQGGAQIAGQGGAQIAGQGGGAGLAGAASGGGHPLPDALARLVAECQALRGQVRPGVEPEPAVVSRLHAAREAQIPLWEARIQALEGVVAAERAAEAARVAAEAGASEAGAGAAAGQASSGRGRSRRPEAPARRAAPAAAPASPAAEALADARQQLRRLRNWQLRRQLRALDEQATHASGARQQELRAEQGRLSASRMREMPRFAQGDSRWGNDAFTADDGATLYNAGPGGAGFVPATLRQGGCGPSSLAIVAQFAEDEDPEAPVRDAPAQMARAVAAVHHLGARGESASREGHRMADGTSWRRVANGLGSEYANLRGRRVEFAEVAATVQSGTPVVWQRRLEGGNHFVVISRFDAARPAPYFVTDPGFRNAWVTAADVEHNSAGFWAARTNVV